ncbi:response regulator [Mucilaginibacter corticis]|uniref:Response regulator n=1 Tax=Mucilaginibacter corticis TaxID=2597670 RepID=A0A556MM52_9SPHI|nr:response regulator [Mucilaginibacter corticis]TSJ41001.1 response regulator [Mucilaginibacter corticis]
MVLKKILVIDDDEDVRLILSDILRQAGYQVKTGKDVTAVYEIEKDPPALLLIDNWLEGKTGHDICWQLKQDPRTQNIPVILISATTKLDETARRCGADDYICKPFDLVDLVNKVRLTIRQ